MAGNFPVLVKELAFADAFGALAAGQGQAIKGDLADEVKGVEILLTWRFELVEQEARFDEFFEHGILAIGGVPMG